MKLLTWRQAAEELGEGKTRAAARRLRNAVLAREKQRGVQIATRLGHRGERPQLRVTIAAISRHMPEYRKSKVDQLEANMGEYLESIDERVREHTAQYVEGAIEPRLRELWDRDERVAGAVDSVSQRVVALKRRVDQLEATRSAPKSPG